MLEPEPVRRDNYGMWVHSAMEQAFGDREHIPGPEWDAWCASHGIRARLGWMEADLDEGHPAWDQHERVGGCIGWNPEPPGPEWFMLSIHDTEDGPAVVWYREDDR